MYSQDEIKYQETLKRVKKIKGFYTHLIVYIFVNILIFYLNVKDVEQGESYFQLKNFQSAFFWGIGLLAHGMSTFVPYLILGKDWEERKIKELMEKERNANQWE
jgi:hypothetical protein